MVLLVNAFQTSSHDRGKLSLIRTVFPSNLKPHQTLIFQLFSVQKAELLGERAGSDHSGDRGKPHIPELPEGQRDTLKNHFIIPE